jgi:hypothetical protein
VQVTANSDGTAATTGYQIVDGFGAVQNAAALTALNLSVSGTAVYSIDNNTPVSPTAYLVNYVSGLTLGGTSAGSYQLLPWFTSTAITVSKYTQSISWTPVTSVPFGTGTITPSTLATNTANTAITYAVTSAGTTGCTVNSSTGVISVISGGSCTISATTPSTGDYLQVSISKTFVVAAPVTITVVETGGGSAGTDYTVSGGVITAASNVSINTSDIANLLATGGVTLAGNVVVNAPISWSANTVLTLGATTSTTVAVNANITASGASAGLVITPATYSLNIKDAKSIQLPGASSTLSIGGSAYTLIRSTAGISTMTSAAGNKYALAVPVSYSTSYSRSILDFNFAGTLDGLGNSVDNYKVTYTGSTVVTGIGFFKGLAGGTIRNFGITNSLIYMNSTNSADMAVGGLVGEATGGTLEQVWTNGLIYVRPGATYTNYSGGGLVGRNTSGTLSITRSYSSMSVNSYNGTYTNVYVGGLVGSNIGTWDATASTAGGNITVSEAYATGDLSQTLLTGNHSMGGILGTHRGTGTVSISDVFTWTMQLAGSGETNWGGITGHLTGGSTTINNVWTYNSQLIPSGTLTPTVTPTNGSWNYAFFSTAQVYPAVGSKWYNSANGRQLVNLPMAYKYFYLRPGTNPDGSYGSLSAVWTNGNITTYSPSTYGLTLDGTPTFTINASTPISTTPYSVYYV